MASSEDLTEEVGVVVTTIAGNPADAPAGSEGSLNLITVKSELLVLYRFIL